MAKAEGIWISGVVPRGLSAERAVTLPGGRSLTRLGPTWLGSTLCCRIFKESLQLSASLVWLLIGFPCRPLCVFGFFFPRWSLNSTAHLGKPAVLFAACCRFSPLFAVSCRVSPLFAALYRFNPLFAASCRVSPLFATSCLVSLHRALLGFVGAFHTFGATEGGAPHPAWQV